MDINEFLKLCETKLTACNDLNNAPFGMVGKQAQAYMQGRSTILQWVIEMLPQSSGKGSEAETIAENNFQAALQRGSKIDAIKFYREWKSVGVKEAAKEVLDNWDKLRQDAFSWNGQ